MQGAQLEGRKWMASPQRPDALTAAGLFARDYYPMALGALLGGSVSRGEGRASSDLDVAILNPDGQAYWATFEDYGWPIESFVLTPLSYSRVFAHEVQRRWPIHLVLWAEGLVLYDPQGYAAMMKQEAEQLLAAGPPPLNGEEIAQTRENLTSSIADLADVECLDEMLLIGQELANTAVDSYLGYSCRWLGKGKWRLRYLHRCDPQKADEFTLALTALCRESNKAPLLAFAQEILNLMGGPLFAGRFTAY